MFRPIRKKKNEMDMESVKELLCKARRGILSMHGEDRYPYAVPINYWYDTEEERIFFHSGKTGYKVECLDACDRVAFTVVGEERTEDEAWAPFVESVVVFGKCHAVEDEKIAMDRLRAFAMKYYPDESMVTEGIQKTGKAVKMFEIEIEHMSGKEVQEK